MYQRRVGAVEVPAWTDHQQARASERRNQLTRPNYRKPELLATAPNRVWSWDITKLKGPEKWTYFYLYVILDVFSRYAVGWLLAEQEQYRRQGHCCWYPSCSHDLPPFSFSTRIGLPHHLQTWGCRL